jgi:hypothetical protein
VVGGFLRHRSGIDEKHKGTLRVEPLREGQHDDLLFATCLEMWAWQNAIEKQGHISFPGVWAIEAAPESAALS